MKLNNNGRFFSAIAATLLVFTTQACGGGGGGEGAAGAVPIALEVVLQPAEFPVGLAALPDGRMLFSELKSGRIRGLTGGSLDSGVYARVEVPVDGADGALGLAVDPEFASNGFVYVFHTDRQRRNRVVRFRDAGGVGIEGAVIIDGLPYGGHNGGKLAFSTDSTIFVSTGDAGAPDRSQDPADLAGKILRYTRDGVVPTDNPLPGSPVFALGFRNVFGIAVHPTTGGLFASENGPDCDDELNRVLEGRNYGWRSTYACGESEAEFEPPIRRFEQPIALTGIAFYTGAVFPEFDGQLLVGDYNTGAIRSITLSADGAVQDEAILYAGGSGGVLEIAVSTDGLIYFTTQSGIFRLVRAG